MVKQRRNADDVSDDAEVSLITTSTHSKASFLAGESDDRDSAALRSTTDTPIVSQVNENDRLRSLQEERKRKMDELKQDQTERAEREAATEAGNRKARFNFLMQQTDIFAHFVAAGGHGSRKEGAVGKGGKSRGRRAANRKTEAEEDSELLQEGMTDVLTGAENTGNTRLIVQPDYIKARLYPYQLEGLNWLIKLYENGINGILADEMGLGKTLQTVSFLAFLRKSKNLEGPHLIVTPKSTIGNWMKEFKQWLPEGLFKVVKFLGDKDERAAIARDQLIPGQFNICVTSYDICIREKHVLKKFSWQYLVVDEAHRLKNENSVLSRIVRFFSTANRLLITGTPLQNNLHELWALLNFLLPDLFDDSEDFDAWFDGTRGEMNEEIVEQLHKLLQPFMLRRLKTDVATDLPPKHETKLFVGLSDLQVSFYKRLLMKELDILNSRGAKNKVRLLNIVMQLRKCANHPYLFDGAEPGPPFEEGEHLVQASGKLQVLDKLLKKLQVSGSRVLIFSQMTR